MEDDVNAYHAYSVLSTAIAIAPDGPTQQAISESYTAMVAAGESWRNITVAMAQVITDGLKSGNWPVKTNG